MRIIKPQWVHHDHHPIYSVDVQPAEGGRLATAGYDSKIKLWNAKPIRLGDCEKDPAVPKLLCVLVGHTKSVNCIRWSPDGTYLASASDDTLIILWQLDPGAKPVRELGSKEELHEKWRSVRTIKGHTMDIFGLSWSPDGTWLASCGVDHEIFIWNMATYSLAHQLRGHKGIIKGVVWDPMGNYIATQSDDGSVRVWRTDTWTVEKCIDDFYAKTNTSAMFSRLGWSTDGLSVVTAQAVNSGIPVATCLQRGVFTRDFDLSGHTGAVVACRANPVLFEHRAGDEEVHQGTCMATCDQRGCVAIWMTPLGRARVVIRDLFETSIHDVSWAANGRELYICADEGTVCLLHFKIGELGTALSDEDRERIRTSTYGRSAEVHAPLLPASVSQLATTTVVTPAVPKPVPRKEPKRVVTTVNKTNASSTTPNITIAHTTGSNAPTATTNNTDTAVTAPATAATNNAGSLTSDNVAATSNEAPALTTKPSSSRLDQLLSSRPALVSRVEATNEPQSRQLEGRTKDGRRRITLINHDSGALAPSPQSAVDGLSRAIVPTARQIIGVTSSTTSAGETLKRKRGDDDQPDYGPSVPRDVQNRLAASDATAKDITLNHQIQLACGDVLMMEAKVVVDGGARSNTLVCSCKGAIRWETVVSQRIACISGDASHVVATCTDGSVHVFRTAFGSRLLPPLITGSAPSLIRLVSNSLLVVTNIGKVYLWNLHEKRGILSGIDSDVVFSSKGGLLVDATVVGDGIPVLKVASSALGHASRVLVYSKGLASWVELGDMEASVMQQANFVSSLSVDAAPLGPLHQLQSSMKLGSENTTALRAAQRLPQKFQFMAGCAYLEQQLSSCVLLNSAPEYEYWMQVYTRFLCGEGAHTRLRPLLDGLLGPSGRKLDANEACIEGMAGSNRRALYGKCVVVASQFSATQLLAVEYLEALAQAESDV